jgi:uncharacterized membrane protein
MATIINNPDSGEGNGGGTGMIVGIVVLVLIVILFVAYGLPAIRNNNKGTTVNVPDKVDVNVNDTTK